MALFVIIVFIIIFRRIISLVFIIIFNIIIPGLFIMAFTGYYVGLTLGRGLSGGLYDATGWEGNRRPSLFGY